ncbi:MAG: HAD hydrolase-like protein [Chloroflexota bacterium]|nr:HAD hydrolase-like protein [Chloroflexota bacterium]
MTANPGARSYLLFDIDGTLMEAEGAGRAALERAAAEATGVAGAMDGIVFAGRTDSWILSRVEQATGVRIDRESYVPRYLGILEEELDARNPRALPGVADLLERLAAREDVVLGLCTGNMRAGAFAKLRRAGIDGYFASGGFGDQHEDRVDVTREAARATGWRSGAPLAHVGDTEHDIRAAHALGAAAVGVATGWHGEEQLREADADLLLADLTGGEHTVAALLAVAATAAA